jgi:methylenetetrahydrofolate reductase (NADPH)
VSCRDRNRLALRSQVVGAAALGSEGVLCLYGDPVGEVPRVKDMAATALIAEAKGWAEPAELMIGAVVNPFAPDLDRELRLLERKVAAGAEFVQSQMVFDLEALAAFLDRAAGLLEGVRFYAGVALLRNKEMAERAGRLPGALLPDHALSRIVAGDGIKLAEELAAELATMPEVDALHVFPLGAEQATREVAAAFRSPRQAKEE